MIEAGRAGGLAGAVRSLVALVVLLLAAPLPASAQDAYRVEGVPVDVTAANATEARERALDEAYSKAFDTLVERLDGRRPSGVRPADLSQSIEIDDERVTTVRYSAKITVQFDPARVDAALGRAGSAYAGASGGQPGVSSDMGGAPPLPMAVGESVLVLPVYEWSGTRTLWETSNPWYQAWSRLQPRVLTGQATVPRGSGDDRSAVTADQALAGDRDALLALAGGTYGATNAVVVLGTYGVDHAAAEPYFDIVASGFGPQLGGRRLTLRVPGAPHSFVDDLAEKAVAETVAAMERSWQPGMPVAEPQASAAPAVPLGPERDILVTAPLSGPADLGRLRGRIGGMAMVTRDQLVSLSRSQAVLRVHYAGDTDMLRTALIDAGFAVSSIGDGWLVRPSGEAGSRLVDQPPRLPPAR